MKTFKKKFEKREKFYKKFLGKFRNRKKFLSVASCRILLYIQTNILPISQCIYFLQFNEYHTMDIVTLSSKGQIVIPLKIRKKFSLKGGDSLVIVEENDVIRLQPLVNLPELWGVDKLKNTGRMLKEMRKEWDDELEDKAAL